MKLTICKIITDCVFCILFIASYIRAEQGMQDPSASLNRQTHIYTKEKLDSLMVRPKSLEGYRSNQSGPLSRLDSAGKEITEPTYTVEKIKVKSDDLLINGWLYLPLKGEPYPLVVLTNGGGDGSRAIKSLSDFLAPILAHCGIAAFVHDKRGTGESEGDYAKTTYEDYIRDAGACAIHLAKDPRIDTSLVGVMGGSEGGRVAVVAACRYPQIKFVISQAGTVVSPIEDRLNAQLNGLVDGGALPDSMVEVVKPLWIRSFEAWASGDPAKHEETDREIRVWRTKYNASWLPYMKREMDSIPGFMVVLPTWNSMGYDYMKELEHFTKPWLAIFGEIDRVVPTDASIRNILKYMELSENSHYYIAILPRCGHSPVDVETRRMVRFDYLTINWLNENILIKRPRSSHP
jgi:pimeloyl-ACP methyl ester carboxylesterase